MERKILSKKKTILISLAVVITVLAGIVLIPTIRAGEKPVGFKTVKADSIPKTLEEDVIPEYKALERALACVVGDDIYVIVSRGEKPSSGFSVKVDRMAIEKEKGKTNWIVYALFTDPEKETKISQIITYPITVVKTELTSLPDTIELRIEY